MKLRYSLFAMLALGVSMLQAQTLQLTPDNIDEIVAAMTLEEKAALLVGGGNRVVSGGDGSMIGHTEKIVPGAAGTTTQIDRLGIPSTVLADGPAGLRIDPTRKGETQTYYCTGFPVGVCMASTWNTDLVNQVGRAMGNEVLEYGVDVILAPGMNIHRSPLCGRNYEYYSEDPLLTGKIAASFVRGVQSNGVGTSIKHFAANSQETNRTGVNEIVSPRALREIYLKGFEIAVKEGKPWTVMSSYNKINGSFTQEDVELLTGILRDEWCFDGIVMTDWVGPRNTARQIQAGNDLMEPGNIKQVKEIIAKVESGELKMEEVDRCVKRVLEFIVKTPRYHGYKYGNRPDFKAHADITRQSATEGMVLLKNDNNTLPMQGVDTVALFGICSYDFIGGGKGSGNVNRPYVVDLLSGFSNAGITVTEDLKNLYTSYKGYQENIQQLTVDPFEWIWGKDKLPEMPMIEKVIKDQSDKAQMAILTLGRQGGESNDRKIDNDFNLSDMERRMLNDICNAFHSKGKKVVVILNTGGVMETASWKDLPDAILLAWMPGQEGGNSVVDVLTGKQTPSGKLTQTWPIAAMDHPSSLNFPINQQKGNPDPLFGNYTPQRNVDYTLHEEGVNVGYRYFDTAGKPVSYPFGYGMSYTTFEYSKPTVKADADGFTATITIRNTGSRPGKEIVEVYVNAPKSNIDKPANELKAFGKTRELQPGESQTLTFKVSNYDLASYHEDVHSWIADKGRYNVRFGASVADIRKSAVYNMKKDSKWETNDIMHTKR